HKEELLTISDKEELLKQKEELLIMNEKHNEVLFKLTEKRKDDEAELVSRTARLFKLLKITNVREALWFICGRIIYKKAIDPLDIHEPIDNLLETTLNEDAYFKEKTCKVNNVTTDAVKKCIGGLYHTSSKGLHGYDKIAIRAKDWEVNEIIAWVSFSNIIVFLSFIGMNRIERRNFHTS
ncbi:10082_t:CDS:2, partial [Funneliformis mosseae]